MEQVHDGVHPQSPPPSASASPDTTLTVSPNRRQQFHAAARLQLAAALLEYDYEIDGKLAEHSAIFAPYRQEPDLSAVYPGAAAVSQPGEEDGLLNYVDHQPGSRVSAAEHARPARYSIALNDTHSAGIISPPSLEPRKSFDFLSPRSENGPSTGPLSDSALSPPHQALSSTLNDDDLQVDEAELASEWGLDNVVSKFERLDSNAFRAEASKIQAAQTAASSSNKVGGTTKSKNGRRKRSGTSGSDILLNLGGIHLDAGLRLSRGNGNDIDDGLQDAKEELDPTFGMDAHSAPTVLDMNVNTNKKQQKKLRHRSGSLMKETRKSLEVELEMAFSVAGSGAGDLDGAISQYGGNGGRSRSSSLGDFNNVFVTPEVAKGEAVQAVADYAAEAVARPPSSLSTNENGSSSYVSRFDPKAIAAQKDEELSTRPRFPNALHPKILVMPAPLAELEAEAEEAKALEEAAAQAENEGGDGANNEKPRIEREAGKLYGRSLMDELQFRKERQKLRNRAFRGDSRKAMMDISRYKRSPSPLASSNPGERGEIPQSLPSAGNGNDEDSDDDDNKPLRPPTSKSPIGDDPWIKYTSHRSLANLANGKSISSMNELAVKDGIKSSPTSPARLSPDRRKSFLPALDTQRHTLSTAELQEQYKKNRQSMLDLNTHANADEDISDDEDDDIPLGTRQEQLTSAQQQQQADTPSPGLIEEHPLQRTKLKEAQSVFGVDLVMQKELAKLEQILEIEEAERKIQAERQRIKDAEREAKDAKKRAKAAKKEKKKALKEKAKAQAVGKERISEKIPQHTGNEVDMQWRSDDRASVANALDRPCENHVDEWHDQDYRRKSYYSMQAHGEHDDFFGAEDQRNSLMPENFEDGAVTPKPGRARSSSLAPSLTLPFLSGDAAAPGVSDATGTLGWFSDDKGRTDHDSDDEAGSDREERVRSKSPFGIENFASDDEERVDDDAAAAIWAEDAGEEKARMREIAYNPSKKPELNRMSVAASFAGVLEGFGIGGGEDEASDDEEDKENNRTSYTRRISVHKNDQSDSDEEEDERRPLSTILLGNSRRSQAFPSSGKPFAKVAFEAPRLDLPMDFATAAKEEDSDSEAEDDAPLALKRLNASLTAGDQGRTYDSADVQGEEEEDSEEDDLPLAVKQDDDKPLGQAHPVAALSQQMEMQQQQNMALMSHLQLQYQYAMQMQMQQAIIQQADIQGYAASQLNYVPPSAALSGAASDIGVDLGPDPKLVNSVDRWRQGVQH